MSCDDWNEDDEEEAYSVMAIPKTIKAAIKLANKHEDLEKRDSFSEELIVIKNSKLLSTLSSNPKAIPIDISHASLSWYFDSPINEDKNKIHQRMLNEFKKYFRKVGLNPNDYKFRFFEH